MNFLLTVPLFPFFPLKRKYILFHTLALTAFSDQRSIQLIKQLLDAYNWLKFASKCTLNLLGSWNCIVWGSSLSLLISLPLDLMRVESPRKSGRCVSASLMIDSISLKCFSSAASASKINCTVQADCFFSSQKFTMHCNIWEKLFFFFDSILLVLGPRVSTVR